MKFNSIIELSPYDFEIYIASILEKLGYKVKHISPGDDIGIDVLAIDDYETIAIQIKKYIKRKINLATIYHTYGAAAYYDCTKAVIVTLSDLTPKASKVAKKLNIEVWGRDKLLDLVEATKLDISELLNKDKKHMEDWFYEIWETHIKLLEEKRVKHVTRDSYITVISVDDDGMSIINSKGSKKFISMDTFLQALTRLRNNGRLTREEINNDYQRRGSSAISAVLLTIPNVYRDNEVNKTTLVWKKQ